MTDSRFRPGWLERHRVALAPVERASIIGIGHVMAEVDALLARLRDPERAAAMGVPPPRGILLWGAPGVGKTLVARYIASAVAEHVPLYELGSDELSPARMRGMLAYLADAHQRSVIYIDEIDQWAMNRSSFEHSPETRLLLAAALAALDGLVPSVGPIVIAASNHGPYHLDKALMRSGRFGVRIQFDTPNENERVDLFTLFLQGRADSNVDIDQAAALTGGLTPADLRGIVDDAAGLALAGGRDQIVAIDLLEALRRVGDIIPPDKARSPQSRERTAIHEAGHVAAIVNLSHATQIRSVRMMGGRGLTAWGDEESSGVVVTDDLLLDRLVVAMAGLVAEGELLRSGSFGGTDDVLHATEIAIGRLEAGLDPAVPPVSLAAFGDQPPEVLASARATFIATLLDDARQRAALIVAANHEPIRTFASALDAADELTGAALNDALASADFIIVEGSRLPRPAPWAATSPR